MMILVKVILQILSRKVYALQGRLEFHGIRKIKYAKHEHNIATHMNVRTHILLIRMKEWAGVLPMILIYRLAMK